MLGRLDDALDSIHISTSSSVSNSSKVSYNPPRPLNEVVSELVKDWSQGFLELARQGDVRKRRRRDQTQMTEKKILQIKEISTYSNNITNSRAWKNYLADFIVVVLVFTFFLKTPAMCLVAQSKLQAY